MPTLKLGSTTALTESSGALTINVANPTVTLGNNTTFGSDVSLSNATFPAGHILKVQHKDDYTGTNTYTGSAMTMTGVGDTITYTAGNKIFIIFQMQYDVSGGGVSVGTQFKIYDETNGSEINQSGNSLGNAYYAGSGYEPAVSISAHHTALYAPSGTSLNVQMYHSCPWGGSAAIMKDRCSLTMMEVQV